MAKKRTKKIQGLQTGTVVQLADDPAGEQRILVKIPVIDMDDIGIWARVSTLDAGNSRGSFFLPEIGDEVIVGFINDDPNEAVVLGMLNSSKNPAPILATDTNDVKGFVTRSWMKFIFNDREKSILIETPLGNRIRMDEEKKSIQMSDQFSNSIIMNESGITIDSPRTVEIKGSTGLKLSSHGITDIKGSMVNIN